MSVVESTDSIVINLPHETMMDKTERRKPLPINKELKKYAVEMRKNPTDEERKVWYQILRGRVPKFHRQRIIGNYIVDFYCPELRLAIEIDGYQHYSEENATYDNARTDYIQKQDIYILRFDNSEVNKDIEYVRYIIDTICEARKNGIPVVPDYR